VRQGSAQMLVEKSREGERERNTTSCIHRNGDRIRE
jgi:hypothetical protein